MGTKFSGKRISGFIIIAAVLLAVMAPAVVHAAAATMRDYCQVPPFIGVVKPNLLLVLDNSASMYDLEYVDTGRKFCSTSHSECVINSDCPNKVCSITTTTSCTVDSNCPSGEFCKPTEVCGGVAADITRAPSYCYDESFNSTKTYEGYFDTTYTSAGIDFVQYYYYDILNNYFVPTPTFPTDAGSCASSGKTPKFVANTLCVEVDTTTVPNYTLKRFVASGKYLNWLTASKFDIEKGILTGGKYDASTGRLIAQSRGCVGRKFVKEALTADFVNYNGCATPPCDLNNTGLGITYGVRGPVNPTNPTDVSTGGQTYVDIFWGNYDAAQCQEAINLYQDPGATKEAILKAVGYCLGSSTTNKKYCSLSGATECTVDNDCAGTTSGTCNITAGSCDGVGGVCDIKIDGAFNGTGVCTPNSGTCTGGSKCVGGNRPGSACTRDQDCTGNGTCMPTCSGGKWAGATCANDAACAYSSCTNGDTSTNPKFQQSCLANSDCDVKWCTNNIPPNPRYHQACGAPSECNVGACTAPPSKFGVACAQSSDCNVGTCSAASPANANGFCTVNDNCNLPSKGVCMAPVTTQIASTFTQSMNTCYQYMRKNIPIGLNEIQQISNPNGCNQIYSQNRICSGGVSDGHVCDTLGPDPKCPGGSCINGPEAIRAGSPVLLCNGMYTGYCALNGAVAPNDPWTTTNWIGKQYSAATTPDCKTLNISDAECCILKKYEEYCQAAQIPPVVDPTDDPSNTSIYDNLPAILADVSVVTQLKDPIGILTVQVGKNTAPTGLIQDFATMIRIGAMSFDFNGSYSECGTRDPVAGTSTGLSYCTSNPAQTCSTDATCQAAGQTGQCVPAVPCPYVCANSPKTACTIRPDGTNTTCDPGVACVLSTSILLLSNPNQDGSEILPNAYVGDNIPTIPSGGHSVAGLINTIDGLGAGAWTPFAEALYNAVGYYASDSSRRLNSSDFSTTPAPSQSNCQKNNILMITDGQPTADLNATVTSVISANSTQFPSTNYSLNYNTTFDNACYKYAGSKNIDDLAWLAQHRDIHNFANAPVYDKDRIRTYTVFSGSGTLTQPDCSAMTDAQLAALNECQTDNLMCKTARNGKGTYYMAQDPAALKKSLKDAFLEIAAKATSGTAASVLASGEGSGANLIQALFYPRRTFDFNTETLWAGSLQNLWYYVDPFFSNSNIREDTVRDGILNLQDDYVVRLFFNNNPTVNKVQVERSADTNGDGSPDTPKPTIEIEKIGSLWESGMQLWSGTSGRNIYTDCSVNSSACIKDAATISTGVMAVSTANFSTAAEQAYLNPDGSDAATKAASAADIINYTLGTDIPGYRPRTVTIDLNGNAAKDAGETQVWKLGDVLNSTPKIASWMPLNTFNKIYGDNTYGLPFQDLNPSDGDNEGTFITSRAGSGYRNRGMAFAGANDGMLHAFRLGTLQLKWHTTAASPDLSTDPQPPQTTKMQARLLRTCSKSNKVCSLDTDCPGDSCPKLGQEMWAYVPKNALPYLKYIADTNYCHVYTVDLTPFIFDASIESPDYNVAAPACADGKYWNCPRTKDSWRTIVIGGMRYGGGCKAKVCSGNLSKKCDDVNNPCGVGEGTCGNPSADTIGTPLLDPADATKTKGLGYSTYFALDVTESLADASKPPRLLWEFANEELGLSSAAPAVVRIKALTNPAIAFDAVNNGPEGTAGSRDGKWFVVLGSGPTGPIFDTQNMARSDQNLKLFILDLKDGSLQRTIDTTIGNAFAGSMLNSTFDSDLDYQDDVVYFGYVEKCVDNSHPCTVGTWTDGGVGRLITTTRDADNHALDALNVNNWEFSKVIDGIGPVTSSVVKLQNNKTNKLWLYFGTGRYIYKTSTEADDNSTRRTLFGVTDPCFTQVPPFKATCDTAANTRVLGDLNNATDVTNAQSTDTGWYVSLTDAVTDPDPTKSLGAERVITDPLATSSGMVFFTTFAPYYDICTLGGKSYVWALKYDTAESPAAMLKGKALVQVSTGSIEQLDMSTTFTEKGKRRTSAMEGVPPTAQGLAILSSPPPVKRILHMKER